MSASHENGALLALIREIALRTSGFPILTGRRNAVPVRQNSALLKRETPTP